MATVNKDFKIKSGLIVEGLQGTINGETILTENAGDQYILDLIGGETLVKSVSNEFDVSVGGELSLDRAVVDAYYDAAGSAATAQGNAEDYADGLAGNYDAAGAAGAVASDLSDHISDTSAHGVDGAVVGTTDTQTLTNKTIGDTLNFTGAGAMTINSDSHIVLTPASGSSVKWGSDILATQAYADQAQTDAEAYADSLAGNYDAAGAAAQALTDANSYTDDEIAALVDSAPAMLDTLGELATALQENPDIISDLQDIAAGKQGTLTTGNGIVIDNDLIYIPTSIGSGVSITPSTVEIDRAVVDTWYDASGAAATAEQNAKDYADDLDTDDVAEGAANLYFTNQRAIDAVGGTIGDQIDLLDTDDIEEGLTNLYHTDVRAKASAADLLTGASLTNITITGTGAGLTITAENGVADSTTDDLEEGDVNLYFTDARAQGAINDTTPNFAAVEIDLVAKQVAAQTDAPTAGIQIAHAFAKADYRSAEYLVKVAYGTHTEISKVLLTLDSSDNIAITEYGIVGTNGSASSISAGISGANVQLQVTTANNNSTVTVMGTLLK